MAYRLDHRVRLRRQEAVDQMRSRYRLRLGASIAPVLGPDARECREGPVVVEREPNHVLLGLRVRLRRIFGEAVERYQATVFRLQAASPVRRRRIPDVGDRRPAGPSGS